MIAVVFGVEVYKFGYRFNFVCVWRGRSLVVDFCSLERVGGEWGGR